MRSNKLFIFLLGLSALCSLCSFNVYAELTPEQQAVLNSSTGLNPGDTPIQQTAPQQQFVQGSQASAKPSNAPANNAAANNAPGNAQQDATLANSPQNLMTAPSNLPFKPTSDNLKSLGFKPLQGSPDAAADANAAAATNQSEQVQAPVIPQAPITPPQPQPAPNLSVVSNAAPNIAQQALDDINTEQQQLQQRVAALESSNNAIQKQISILSQYLIGVDEQLSQIKTQLQKAGQAQSDLQLKSSTANAEELKAPNVSFLNYLKHQFEQKSWFKALLVAIVIALLLLLWDLFYRRRQKKVPGVAAEIEEEYNFMNGDEGIAARLNLARAYVDMGNKQAAEQILKEALARGNEVQKAEAAKLLEKVSPGHSE